MAGPAIDRTGSLGSPGASICRRVLYLTECLRSQLLSDQLSEERSHGVVVVRLDMAGAAGCWRPLIAQGVSQVEVCNAAKSTDTADYCHSRMKPVHRRSALGTLMSLARCLGLARQRGFHVPERPLRGFALLVATLPIVEYSKRFADQTNMAARVDRCNASRWDRVCNSGHHGGRWTVTRACVAVRVASSSGRRRDSRARSSVCRRIIGWRKVSGTH